MYVNVCISVNELYLLGIGNELHYYYKNSETQNTENVVLPIKTRDKIHGIVSKQINISNYLILIHSGKEVILLTLNNVSLEN